MVPGGDHCVCVLLPKFGMCVCWYLTPVLEDGHSENILFVLCCDILASRN